MWLDLHTVAALVGSLGLAFILLTIAVWRTRRRYSAYSRWTIAGPVLLLALFLAILRPNVPDLISVVAANALLALSSILCLEGAREFRGLTPRNYFVYAGAVATIGAVAFFLYVIPDLTIRATIMSTWLGLTLGLASVILLRGNVPSPYTLGVKLTGGLFALTAATHLARAVYLLLAPPLTDPFALSSLNGAFFLVLFVELSLFPVGFMLIADDRLASDLIDVRKRMRRADAKVARAREAEAVLREREGLNHDFARRLIVQQELERQRIARELHDDIGQGIALLKVELDTMTAGVDSERTRAYLRRLSSRVGEIASDLHDVSYELHPSKLRALGLVSALQSLCRETSVQRNLHVTFTQRAIPPFVDEDVSLCLYRIAQESLHNIVRHSGAGEAQVTINCDDGQIALQIADSGIGFDPRHLPHAGLGLHSMRERVAILNGQLTIDAAPGRGTQITARILLDGAATNIARSFVAPS
jgi:signal transduction histidine kinase